MPPGGEGCSERGGGFGWASKKKGGVWMGIKKERGGGVFDSCKLGGLESADGCFVSG